MASDEEDVQLVVNDVSDDEEKEDPPPFPPRASLFSQHPLSHTHTLRLSLLHSPYCDSIVPTRMCQAKTHCRGRRRRQTEAADVVMVGAGAVVPQAGDVAMVGVEAVVPQQVGGGVVVESNSDQSLLTQPIE
jgi:hypothetical protein